MSDIVAPADDLIYLLFSFIIAKPILKNNSPIVIKIAKKIDYCMAFHVSRIRSRIFNVFPHASIASGGCVFQNNFLDGLFDKPKINTHVYLAQ